jgi:hypothetical protein
MPDRIVTVVVHGTFATNATWWKLGTNTEPTFADKLEQQLAADGMTGTVWKPALEAGMTYDDFTWSGENRHKDRVAGAHKLSGSLDDRTLRSRLPVAQRDVQQLQDGRLRYAEHVWDRDPTA